MALDYGTRGVHGLSYSRRGTLHECPRKFQIQNCFGLRTEKDSVTFSFGHAVGAGIQKYFVTGNLQAAVIEATLHYSMGWGVDGTTSEQRAKKNIWYAIHAIHCFHLQLQSDPRFANLRNWEVATIGGKPAQELQFRLLLGNDFVYEGHIDLVLRHKVTGQYCVLELKTTSLQAPGRAQYGKSDQALSYTIALDHILKDAPTSYAVIYLIWSSSTQSFTIFEFQKSPKQRLNWINDLLREVELLSYYESCAARGIPYPINGASCFSFFHECEYFTTCELEDESLKLIYSTTQNTESFNYQDNCDFIFTVEEALETQLAKVSEQLTDPLTLIDTTTETRTGDSNGEIINI